MGAVFMTMRLSGTADEVRKKFRAQQDQDSYSRGNEYSGGWNMVHDVVFTRESFESETDAADWLDRHCEKWGDALAVRIPPRPTETAEMKRLQDRIRELQSESFQYGPKVVARIRAGKSLLRTCPKCTSKIATTHVRCERCPVCGSDDFGYTDTDRKALARLEERIKELQARRDELVRKASGAATDWLIGGVLAE